MKMPGMDGAELLTEIMRLYPATIRLILSGHAGKESILKSVEPTHQYIAKPCNSELLKSTILGAYALRDLLGNSELEKMVAGMRNLPSMPRNLPGMLKHRGLESLTVELPSLSVGLQDRERLVKTRNLIRHKKSAPPVRLCS